MMTKKRKPWGLIAYSVLAFSAVVSYFMLREWWYDTLKIVLNYFREVSIIFGFLCFFTIFFHFRSIKEKEIIPEKKGFYFLGPFIYLIARPSITSSIFYVALFMLYVIINGPFYDELPTQELIVLLAVIGGLLYWSTSELFEMIREICRLETSVKVQSRT